MTQLKFDRDVPSGLRVLNPLNCDYALRSVHAVTSRPSCRAKKTYILHTRVGLDHVRTEVGGPLGSSPMATEGPHDVGPVRCDDLDMAPTTSQVGRSVRSRLRRGTAGTPPAGVRLNRRSEVGA